MPPLYQVGYMMALQIRALMKELVDSDDDVEQFNDAFLHEGDADRDDARRSAKKPLTRTTTRGEFMEGRPAKP